MKRIRSVLLVLLLGVFLLTSTACDASSVLKTEAADPNAVTFTLYVACTVDWTPFPDADEVTFSSDNNAVSLQSSGNTVTCTGVSAGEATVTATAGAEHKEAYITVKESYVEVGETDGTVDGWLAYFAAELQGKSGAEQAEYLLSVADYTALALAAHETDASFVNMAEAAARLYPTSYMLNNYAALCMDQHDFEEAAVWLEKAVDTGENNPVILTNLAQCYYEMGDYEAAAVYAEKALLSEPDYGLAHLILCCVHLQNGRQLQAMEALFRSIRTHWTETSRDLMRDLLQSVREAAGLASDTSRDTLLCDGIYGGDLGEMVLTEEHITLLFEAAAAGNISDGRDIPENQISLPFPLDPSDAATAGAWDADYSLIAAYNDELYDHVAGYLSHSGRDERGGYCLAFLTTYYEYQIAKVACSLYDIENAEDKYGVLPTNPTLAALVRDQMDYSAQREKEVDEIIDEMTVTLSIGLTVKYADPVKVALLKAEMFDDFAVKSDAGALDFLSSVRDLYERNMRPLLEEYYLRMNAMLGYVQDTEIRSTYEARMVIILNREQFLNPIDIMLFGGCGSGDACREVANQYRQQAGLEQQRIAERRDAELLARKSETGQLKDSPLMKEVSMGDVSVTIPPGSPIYVRFGMSGNSFSMALGAFGNEVIREKDFYTGFMTETVITNTSVLPMGLNELNTLIGELSGVISAKNGKEWIEGKINPIGSIPSFDKTKGEGKSYTYDEFGRLVDITEIREETTSAAWGPISVSQTVTKRRGYMASSWSSSTKSGLSFGPFSVAQ